MFKERTAFRPQNQQRNALDGDGDDGSDALSAVLMPSAPEPDQVEASRPRFKPAVPTSLKEAGLTDEIVESISM